MQEFEMESPVLGDTEPESKGSGKKIIIIVLILVLVLAAVGVTLFFVLRKSDSSDSTEPSPATTPFNKIVKDDSEIHLVPVSGKYDYILIFMHGLLGKPEEYLSTFNKKDGPIPDNFKIILPCAPTAFVTRLNFSTTSWFDLLGENGAIITEDDIVFDDLVKSADRIKKLIEEEAKAVNNDYSKVFVGGFSQGACMSFHIGLSFNYTLGGVISFCGVPNTQTQIQENRTDLNIFSILGGKDEYFPVNDTKTSIETILANFTNLQIKVYEKEEHAVTTAGLEDVKKYIKNLTKL
jgi:predicted esterase